MSNLRNGPYGPAAASDGPAPGARALFRDAGEGYLSRLDDDAWTEEDVYP